MSTNVCHLASAPALPLAVVPASNDTTAATAEMLAKNRPLRLQHSCWDGFVPTSSGSNLGGQFGNKSKEISNHSIVGNLEDWCVRVLVDGYDGF
mmetsp:Transcript_79286/g.157014  ORF Transcript_79286/g.157014 Transcript_79286/m.157014 type:complete len:94 (-) Transcript_79286:976-1257(-)